jgi:hypothetical protein
MANESQLGRVTSPYQKYFFHFLPGLPILVGIFIIFYEVQEIKDFFESIFNHFVSTQPKGTSWGLLGFTFFLILLVFALAFVFLFGMIADAARHMLEEMFLVAKWSEYKVVQRFKNPMDETTTRSFETKRSDGKKESSETEKRSVTKQYPAEYNWGMYEKINESEYYYTEFFGNVAISLAFLWCVFIWFYGDSSHTNFYVYLIWILLVFLLRPFISSVLGRKDIKKPPQKIRRFPKALKNICYRFLDFLATSASIIFFTFGWLLFTDPLPLKFYILGFLLVTIPFDLYITRYRRYQALLKTLFVQTESYGSD